MPRFRVDIDLDTYYVERDNLIDAVTAVLVRTNKQSANCVEIRAKRVEAEKINADQMRLPE